MDQALQNDIIIFTLLQELKRESSINKSLEVRIFCEYLLGRVNFELDNWKDDEKY